MSQFLIILLIILFVPFTHADTRKQVETEINRVNAMREGLVTGVRPPVSQTQFKAVCGPVGQSLKKLGIQRGWHIRQASHKNRNPKNKADALELAAIKVFQKDQAKNSYWQETEKGSYYFQRIKTKGTCLACHGPKDTRPDFVKKKYPKDLAFDFKEGELRGIYSVFVANEKKLQKKTK